MKTILLFLTLLAAALTCLHAGEKPLLAIPGKVLQDYKFDSAAPAAPWAAAKGDWKIADGALQGSEIEADEHGAVLRLQEQFSDLVIEAEIKLDGAKSTSLSVNAVKDHMARIAITPTRITIRRDDNDHEGPDKAITFASFEVDLTPGTWHKVRLEMVGDTMLGQFDDLVAWGSDPLFETPKADPGFTAGGQSVSIRNVTIREATLNPNWDAVKKTLPAPGEKLATPPAANPKGGKKGAKKAAE